MQFKNKWCKKKILLHHFKRERKSQKRVGCALKEKALPRKKNEVARQLAYPQRMKATSSEVENAAFGV